MTKIFCIGAHKTGTCSLANAFQILGYSVCPQRPLETLWDYHSNLAPLKKFADNWDVFQDTPWNSLDFYKLLHSWFPDAYFILVERDVNEWADSYERFIASFGGWQSFPHIFKQHFISCYGTHGISADNREICMANYLKRNAAICDYFAQNSHFISLKMSELNWSSLCEFLNVSNVPTVPFPHLNKTGKK